MRATSPQEKFVDGMAMILIIGAHCAIWFDIGRNPTKAIMKVWTAAWNMTMLALVLGLVIFLWEYYKEKREVVTISTFVLPMYARSGLTLFEAKEGVSSWIVKRRNTRIGWFELLTGWMLVSYFIPLWVIGECVHFVRTVVFQVIHAGSSNPNMQRILGCLKSIFGWNKKNPLWIDYPPIGGHIGKALDLALTYADEKKFIILSLVCKSDGRYVEMALNLLDGQIITVWVYDPGWFRPWRISEEKPPGVA